MCIESLLAFQLLGLFCSWLCVKYFTHCCKQLCSNWNSDTLYNFMRCFICSDRQHQGKKIHCVLKRGWYWVTVEFIVRRILLRYVFWPRIQSARQNFKCESIGKYLFQGKVRWLFQESALLFSIFRGLLEQLLLWASSKLEICGLQNQLLLTDTAR